MIKKYDYKYNNNFLNLFKRRFEYTELNCDIINYPSSKLFYELNTNKELFKHIGKCKIILVLNKSVIDEVDVSALHYLIHWATHYIKFSPISDRNFRQKVVALEKTKKGIIHFKNKFILKDKILNLVMNIKIDFKQFLKEIKMEI